jgi:hypothetical protein
LWQRSGIPYPTDLHFGPGGHWISCVVEDRKVELIDPRTGETNTVLDRARNYFEGPCGQLLTVPKGRAYLLRTGAPLPNAKFQVDQLAFALLDAAFSPDSLYLTEPGGPTRCIDCLVGSERWRFDPPLGSHVLKLYYSAKDNFTYGILWHYEQGLFRYLVRFNPTDGQMVRLCSLDSWEEAFVPATHQLITSSGSIVNLADGEIVGMLRFPQKRYPD